MAETTPIKGKVSNPKSEENLKVVNPPTDLDDVEALRIFKDAINTIITDLKTYPIPGSVLAIGKLQGAIEKLIKGD